MATHSSSKLEEDKKASSLIESAHDKVEKETLAKLLNISEDEKKHDKTPEEIPKMPKESFAIEEGINIWEDSIQKFNIWSKDLDVTPKEIEDRLECVSKMKNDILSIQPHSTWVNNYLSHSALQNFLRSIMKLKLSTENQEHIKSIMQNILKKDEIDQIDQQEYFAIEELLDWIYSTTKKIKTPYKLKNITNFTTFEYFLKEILEHENDKESDSMLSDEVLSSLVAEGINYLLSNYKQTYDDIFIYILIQPYLSQYSSDTVSLRSLTLNDLSDLQKQFSQQRMKFSNYESSPLILQSYLFLLVIETCKIEEKDVVDLIRNVGQMMQKLEPPLDQILSHQIVQKWPLADLKQILQHNMIIHQQLEPFPNSSSPQRSPSQCMIPKQDVPIKPTLSATPSPSETPNPLQLPASSCGQVMHQMQTKGILRDRSLDLSLNPLNFLQRLGLGHCRLNKLQLQDALCIRPQILELSLKETPIADPKLLPYLVLQNVISYDSKCRSDLFIGTKPKSVSSQKLNEDFGDYGDPDDESEFNEEDRYTGIHPLDSLLAVLVCADDFLRQDLFSRLAMCQIAVPFILPDPFTKKPVIPLWALRTILKEWESSENQKMKQSHLMVTYSMPIVCFLRFGTPQKSGHSKSKILNDIICTDNCNRYFHRNCPGGHYKSVLVDGLVDMCWYLPSGKTSDLYPDAITFLNLHGDARDHSHQAEYISEISSMCVVMLHEDGIEFDSSNMAVLNKLYSSAGGLTFLNDVRKRQTFLRTSFPKAYWVNLTSKNDSQTKDVIVRRIKSRLETIKHFKSLEVICAGQQSNFVIDEHSELCKIGQKQAKALISILSFINLIFCIE